jgi:DNA-binding transcriptional LysR family regulator
MRGPIEMRDLEAFVAIAETGSFTVAAQRLLLSQPTVSARIASLESALDARLFDRGSDRAHLTPAGKVLHEQARRLLRAREDAVKAVDDFLGRLHGPLLIGGSTIPGSYLLPALLAELRVEHPGLRIVLAVEDTDKMLAALRQGDIELCVVGREVEEAGLDTSVVGRDEVVLVATPGLAERTGTTQHSGLEILKGLPLVLREVGSGTRASALAALERAGADVSGLRIALEIGSNAAAREAALAGVGAAFLSRLAVEREIREGELVVLPVAGAALSRPLVLVTRSGRTLSPGAAALVRKLRDRRFQ